MRLAVWLAWFMCVALGAACASTPPHSAPPAAQDDADDDDAGPPQQFDAGPEPVPTVMAVDTPERSRPPSTASYEQATATPESLNVNDDHLHLTDGQLNGPVRGALNGCRVPQNAKVTIKTAVQYGRAIGVTVNVRFVKPKSAKPPSRAKAQKEAKAAAKISACVDHNVRDIVWPPSRRRDSFTTEF